MFFKLLSLAAIFAFCPTASAEIKIETFCYVYAPPSTSSKPIYLALRTYRDLELNKEIGAFIQYKNSKQIIPVVLVKYAATDTDSPN